MSNRHLLGVEDGGGGCGVEGGGMDGVVGVGGDEGGGGVEVVGRMGDDGGGGGVDGAIGVGVDGRSDGGGGGFDGAAMITMPLLCARMYGSDLAGCER